MKEMYIYLCLRCWSYVGDLKNGKQQISIGNLCYFHGIVLHEIGHALGRVISFRRKLKKVNSNC